MTTVTLNRNTSMPTSDKEVYPIDTVVRIKKTNLFAIVRQHTYLKHAKYFLNYLCEVKGKKGLYCVIHDDVELECLPNSFFEYHNANPNFLVQRLSYSLPYTLFPYLT